MQQPNNEFLVFIIEKLKYRQKIINLPAVDIRHQILHHVMEHCIDVGHL